MAKHNQPIVFRADNITKRFAGVTALDAVSIDVYKGMVNVIVGENGAGKSTLMKILSGVYPDYEGHLYLEDQEVHFGTPKEAMLKGIAIIHQELNLIPYLSISANIFLGREMVNNIGFLDFKTMHSEAKKLLQRVNCDLNPRTLVSELRVGQQQLVEIAKALLEDAKVMIMDEPTSAITDTEVESLFVIIKSLKEQGVAILYISHKLDELFQIADRFIGLRDGKMVGTIETNQNVSKDELIRLMVGEDIKNEFEKSPPEVGMELLKVSNICLPKLGSKIDYLVQNVNFTLKSGEVLGIFGLMGAGRTELLESLFGLYPKYASGQVFVDGKEVQIKSVCDAISHGMALVPEDRKEDGLVLQMPIYKNVSMASMFQFEDSGFVIHNRERSISKKYIDDLGVKANSYKQIANNLSGGNQQKVVLSKWLATKPKILFLDEPTRGIDVNAKNDIYHVINELAKKGLGVIVVSSEIPEIMAISDRIIVMSESRITGEFDISEANKDVIMKAAIL